MSELSVRLDWQHCRYLACPAYGVDGRFRRLLKDLGLDLPRDLEPAELVRHGWIEPVLRVELPTSFYLSWKSFPSYPIQGTIAEEDYWASQLWALGAIQKRGSADPQTVAWYRHFLDMPDHWVTRAALAHQLPTDGSHVPDSFVHPRPPGRTVHPWIDFFAYWQALPRGGDRAGRLCLPSAPSAGGKAEARSPPNESRRARRARATPSGCHPEALGEAAGGVRLALPLAHHRWYLEAREPLLDPGAVRRCSRGHGAGSGPHHRRPQEPHPRSPSDSLARMGACSTHRSRQAPSTAGHRAGRQPRRVDPR